MFRNYCGLHPVPTKGITMNEDYKDYPRLSSIPWNDIQKGDRVISAIGNEGQIERRFLDYSRNSCVEIHWDNGKKSFQPVEFMDKVIYVGR